MNYTPRFIADIRVFIAVKCMNSVMLACSTLLLVLKDRLYVFVYNIQEREILLVINCSGIENGLMVGKLGDVIFKFRLRIYVANTTCEVLQHAILICFQYKKPGLT